MVAMSSRRDGEWPTGVDVSTEALATLYEHALRGGSDRELYMIIIAIVRELCRARLPLDATLAEVDRLLPPLTMYERYGLTGEYRSLHDRVIAWCTEAHRRYGA